MRVLARIAQDQLVELAGLNTSTGSCLEVARALRGWNQSAAEDGCRRNRFRNLLTA
jgi:hypothetical protein